jgi:hypothetical protein
MSGESCAPEGAAGTNTEAATTGDVVSPLQPHDFVSSRATDEMSRQLSNCHLTSTSRSDIGGRQWGQNYSTQYSYK